MPDKKADYDVEVKGVEISPDPVARGQPATFSIAAATSTPKLHMLFLCQHVYFLLFFKFLLIVISNFINLVFLYAHVCWNFAILLFSCFYEHGKYGSDVWVCFGSWDGFVIFQELNSCKCSLVQGRSQKCYGF